MIDLACQEEVVILVAVSPVQEEVDLSLDELGELARSAGARVAGRCIQLRDEINPATYLGSGKIPELKEMAGDLGATGIICDDELSSAQLKNLEEALEIKVIDRTMLILDIFAARAFSREGKIQVELAQLHYRVVRLVGLRASLSRLGGGIGTRGPGEKKLEMDRRLIRKRMGQLKSELADVRRHRDVVRTRRMEGFTLRVAVVGYTNAGKSTLFNRLTSSGVPAQDQLFVTLDPTTRQMHLKDGQLVLLTDTVGFIRKLPHHLVEAFQSTLEEARYCDVIFLVVDASSPQMDMHLHVVKETLRELGAGDKPVVTLFNKIDKLSGQERERVIYRDFSADYQLRISAKTGEGLVELEELLSGICRSRQVYLEKVYPYSQGGRIQRIRSQGRVISEDYLPEGIRVTAYVPAQLFGEFYRDE